MPKERPIVIDLRDELRKKGLLKYNRAAIHSTVAYWEENDKKPALREEAIERGVTTAQLLKEYNE